MRAAVWGVLNMPAPSCGVESPLLPTDRSVSVLVSDVPGFGGVLFL